MTPEWMLALRIFSALLLLAFLGLLIWFIRKDVETSTSLMHRGETNRAVLFRLGDYDDKETIREQFELAQVTTIGRAADNAIIIDDDYVSNNHAKISAEGRLWWIEDLQSRNGTLLNGAELTTIAVLSSGDVITIGNSEFRIELL